MRKFGALLLLAVGFGVYWNLPSAKLPSVQAPGVAVKSVGGIDRSTAGAPSVASAPVQSVIQQKEPENWKNFKQRFGDRLTPAYTPDGHLVAVRGFPDQPARATGFNPESKQDAIARAQEVLHEARDLIGVSDQLPLSPQFVSATKNGARVYFKEEWAGIRVEPHGTFAVDLGREGEVKGVDVDYIPRLRVSNELALTEAEATQKAAELLQGRLRVPLTIHDAEHVIWVPRPLGEGAAAPEARHAYRFNPEGREIVIDGSSGRVLHERDHRIK